MVLILLCVAAAVALWIVPILEVQQLSGDDPAALFQAENGARLTLAIILGAAGALLAAGIIWRRYEISRELKTHERYARAVEQIGAERGDGTPRTEVRLGGIYALERLALESDQEYWPVMEVLTAYLRDNATWSPGKAQRGTSGSGSGSSSPRPSADVQAVLAVLGRRRQPHTAAHEKRLLDLRETDLRGANLSGSRLDGVTLFGAHLERADATRVVLSRSNLREASLAGATLTGALLEGASLSKANLEGARLNSADLRGADLSGANLRGADLWEANLKECNLKDADLSGADLSQCVLQEAILWRANLQDAVLTGARLKETHLERANLLGVTGLTWEQGEDAYTDENTVLPEYLAPASASPTPRPAPARPPSPRRAPAAPPPQPPAEEKTDNVVQLNAPARRTRQRKRAAPEPAKPKKAALPKHRKPDLIKPA